MRGDLARYATAACLIVTVASAAAFSESRLPSGDVASEAEDAVLVDLPAMASSAPPSEVADGPEQQAMEAASPAPPVPEIAPDPKPDDTPKASKSEDQPAAQPPPEPKPEAALPPPQKVSPPSPPQEVLPKSPPQEVSTPVVERKPDAPVPQPTAAASAQEAMAPAGARTPVKDAEPIDSDATRRRASRAMSRWQQAMLVRLQNAKSAFRSGGEAGIVKIAFTVDRHGRLASSRVAHSSGSSRLDQLGLALLARAAPFPEPPAASDKVLTFTIPIAFATRH